MIKKIIINILKISIIVAVFIGCLYINNDELYYVERWEIKLPIPHGRLLFKKEDTNHIYFNELYFSKDAKKIMLDSGKFQKINYEQIDETYNTMLDKILFSDMNIEEQESFNKVYDKEKIIKEGNYYFIIDEESESDKKRTSFFAIVVFDANKNIVYELFSWQCSIE